MKLRFVAGLLAALLPGLALAQNPPIPLFSGPWDPSNTQLNVNTLILEINAILTPRFPGGSSGVNVISMTGGVTGSPAMIGLAAGADANAGIQINPNGSGNIILFSPADTGVLQFANATSFVPAQGIGACPSVRSGSSQPFGIHTNIQGFVPIQDWLYRNRYIPVC